VGFQEEGFEEYPLPLPPAAPPPGAVPAAHLSMDNLQRHTQNQPLVVAERTSPTRPPKEDLHELRRQNEALRQRVAHLEEGEAAVRHAVAPTRHGVPGQAGGPGGPANSQCCTVS